MEPEEEEEVALPPRRGIRRPRALIIAEEEEADARSEELWEEERVARRARIEARVEGPAPPPSTLLTLPPEVLYRLALRLLLTSPRDFLAFCSVNRALRGVCGTAIDVRAVHPSLAPTFARREPTVNAQNPLERSLLEIGLAWIDVQRDGLKCLLAGWFRLQNPGIDPTRYRLAPTQERRVLTAGNVQNRVWAAVLRQWSVVTRNDLLLWATNTLPTITSWPVFRTLDLQRRLPPFWAALALGDSPPSRQFGYAAARCFPIPAPEPNFLGPYAPLVGSRQPGPNETLYAYLLLFETPQRMSSSSSVLPTALHFPSYLVESRSRDQLLEYAAESADFRRHIESFIDEALQEGLFGSRGLNFARYTSACLGLSIFEYFHVDLYVRLFSSAQFEILGIVQLDPADIQPLIGVNYWR